MNDRYSDKSAARLPLRSHADRRGKCVCILSVCIALGAFLWLACPACTYASDTLNYLEYQAALQKGRALQRPLLIIFSSPWCYHCTEMKRKISQNRDIVATINERFLLVEVDISENKKLKEDYRIYFTPTIVFLDSHGKPIMDVKGFIPMDRFRKLLRYVSEGFYKTTELAAFEKR